MSNSTQSHRVKPAVLTGLTALGSSQTTAFPLLNNARHEFTTVTASSGAILPVGVTPSEVTIFNDDPSDAMALYPPVGGTIDGGTANASISIAAGTGSTFWAASPLVWYHDDNAATTSSFASIASHDVVANTTGGSAAPAGVTLTSLVDAAIDNTQGDLLYRGASAWSALAPAASAGALLYSGGSAANPAWTTNILRGTDGNLNFAAISHGSPATGDFWYPASDQGTFAIGRASGPAKLGGCIFSCGSCTAVANTSAATSIFGTPTNAKGSLTIPANTLAVGNVLRWKLGGVFGCTGSSPTIAFDVFLNGTDILSNTGPATLASASTARSCFTDFTSWIGITAIGASAAALGFSSVQFNTSGAGPRAISVPGGGASGTTTFASNAGALFDVKVTWSAASATNTFQLLYFALFLDN